MCILQYYKCDFQVLSGVHNVTKHHSQHFLAVIKVASAVFPKSVNYPFKISSQGTCQLRVLGLAHTGLHTLGWSFIKPLWLRVDPLGVIKEPSQGVDLSGCDGEHDKQVEAGPEGHPPQVVLQKVAVPRLKGPQHSLDLAAPLQVLVHRVHRGLEEEEKRGRQEVKESQCWDVCTSKRNDIR